MSQLPSPNEGLVSFPCHLSSLCTIKYRLFPSTCLLINKSSSIYLNNFCFFLLSCWSEKGVCTAHWHNCELKRPLFLLLYFFLSFCATYFSPIRVYATVLKLLIGSYRVSRKNCDKILLHIFQYSSCSIRFQG